MKEARKIGDKFYKENFNRDIRTTANLIMKISVLLIIIELIDEVPILIDVFQEDPTLILFSVIEILVPVVMLVIIFMLVKELKKWDDIYKKIKRLIG